MAIYDRGSAFLGDLPQLDWQNAIYDFARHGEGKWFPQGWRNENVHFLGSQLHEMRDHTNIVFSELIDSTRIVPIDLFGVVRSQHDRYQVRLTVLGSLPLASVPITPLRPIRRETIFEHRMPGSSTVSHNPLGA